MRWRLRWDITGSGYYRLESWQWWRPWWRHRANVAGHGEIAIRSAARMIKQTQEPCIMLTPERIQTALVVDRLEGAQEEVVSSVGFKGITFTPSHAYYSPKPTP